jgi:two-component system NtrC family sensor kinase
MEPDLNPPATARRATAMPWHWPRFRSIRHKLLAMALGPLVVVFPLLVVALVAWGNVAYDRLLVTKVRSDLSVAQGYFDKVLDDVGQGRQIQVQVQQEFQWMLSGWLVKRARCSA